jgi:hypothetical protein
MPKKLTYDQVKDAFKSRGYTLMSTTYESNTSILEYTCNNGHIHKATYKYFTRKLPCLECQKLQTKTKKELQKESKPCKSQKGVPKKFNLEFVRDYMHQQGCELLSTEYTTDRVKLRFVCVCGGIGEQSFNRFYHGGTRCNDKQCIQKRMKKKMLELYGVENAMYSEDIKMKAKTTNLEKYGVGNPFANEEIKNKIKVTNLERYGLQQLFNSLYISIYIYTIVFNLYK